jgi:hypothetical protein
VPLIPYGDDNGLARACRICDETPEKCMATPAEQIRMTCHPRPGEQEAIAKKLKEQSEADRAKKWCREHPTEMLCTPSRSPDQLELRGALEGAPVHMDPDSQLSSGGRVVLHNGSLMRVVMTPDGYLDIFYVEPRPGLNVLPGVRLLRGKWTGPPPQNLVAVAFVFPRPPCRPVPYGVRGVVDQSNTLVLHGPAPTVAPDCTVTGHEWSANSELRFEKVQP